MTIFSSSSCKQQLFSAAILKSNATMGCTGIPNTSSVELRYYSSKKEEEKETPEIKRCATSQRVIKANAWKKNPAPLQLYL